MTSTPYKRTRFVVLCLVVVVCGLSGCRRNKPIARRNMVLPRKSARPSMSDIPAYNRYYAMWRIAHSNLETTIRNKWNLSEIDHTFDQAVQNLRLMNKFFKDKKKAKIASFIDGYEDLRGSVNPGRPSRRTTARLDRLEVRIKKCLSPANVKMPKSKSP